MQQSLSFRLNKVFYPLQHTFFSFSILSFRLFGFVAMQKALQNKTFGKETKKKKEKLFQTNPFSPQFFLQFRKVFIYIAVTGICDYFT